MRIDDIQFPELINSLNPASKLKQPPVDDVTNVTFADTIKNFINTVNEKQLEAGEKVSDIIQGKSEDLAGAMTASQESNLSFQLMLEIRNKLIEAVQEINRIQI